MNSSHRFPPRPEGERAQWEDFVFGDGVLEISCLRGSGILLNAFKHTSDSVWEIRGPTRANQRRAAQTSADRCRQSAATQNNALTRPESRHGEPFVIII